MCPGIYDGIISAMKVETYGNGGACIQLTAENPIEAAFVERFKLAGKNGESVKVNPDPPGTENEIRVAFTIEKI